MKPGFKKPAAPRFDQFTHLETTMEDLVAKVLDFELRLTQIATYPNHFIINGQLKVKARQST